MPAMRRVSPSSTRATAKASAWSSARATATSPCPYAFALITAMTRERGAKLRMRCRLCLSAAVSIVALTIGVMRTSPEYALGVGFRRVVLELRVLAEEGQLHFARGAIALLGDDDIGDAFARGVGVVDVFAIDEENDVCILFQRTALPEIRHHRLLLLTLLHASIELRQSNDRHLQFPGERLERAGDLGNLGRPVLFRPRDLHELKIVDNDEVESALAFQSTSARTDFGR